MTLAFFAATSVWAVWIAASVASTAAWAASRSYSQLKQPGHPSVLDLAE
jgi:hypothetical protein